MSNVKTPQKVAILGGGMGGLTTAFELTSQPGWQDRFDITVYQLGWRLGGKCASSRGPNERIEEHGIHGFMGSYFNALPMMSDVYAALDRAPDQPLATFEEAFLGSNFTMLWEWQNGGLQPWPVRAPSNDLPPTDGSYYKGVPTAILAILSEVEAMLTMTPGVPKVVDLCISALIEKARIQVETIPLSEGPNHPLVAEIEATRAFVYDIVHTLAPPDPAQGAPADALRHALLTLDFYAALVLGTLCDNVEVNGYDVLDPENWSDWLTRHGIHAATLKSPVVMTTVNICYQSPNGDTSRAARMAAGCFLNWTLRSCAYMGSLIWSFASGTGETVVAPMYEVLKRRGVKFEFFRKVENLCLSEDRKRIAAIEMTLQATLKDPKAGYHPLIDVKGLPSWPANPHYDQLVEGEYLRATHIDLESYWNGWPNAAFPHLKTPHVLREGHDYDQIVFAIALGAVPYLCKELLAEKAAWRDMVATIPTLQTQAMQLWFYKDMYELGWSEPLNPAENELALSATYFCPPNGNAEFHDLLKWECWPKDNQPKALWYFCGLMPDYEAPPPFSDTDYPRRQSERVKAQCIQYLQASIGTMLPNATVRANNPAGDPNCLDFDLLVDTKNTSAQGVQRFDSQFWRANIDPTERYVASPPGSTDCRMEAWGSGFDNLVLAGDWIYTGLNVGSFEGATMGGKLASHALCGAPALHTIIGYPVIPRPQISLDRPHAPPPAGVNAPPTLRQVA